MNIGDIVRVSEDSMHWELFQQFDMPPEGILITIDEIIADEKYLVEFVREEHFLHDGGQMDDAECRYWIDKIDLLEECPQTGLNSEFFYDELIHPQPAPQPAPEPPRPRRVQDIPVPEPDQEFFVRWARGPF